MRSLGNIVDFTYNYTSCDIACSVATTEPRPTGDCVDGGISLVGYPPPMKELGDTSKFPIWGDESVLPPNAKL